MSGLLAEFADEDALLRARDSLRADGVASVETYTPSAPEDAGGSVLPLVILVAGLLGAAGTFLMQAYATVWSYPMNVGGRPDFSWPAYVPMAFEMGVLSAVAAGVVGFLVANRLPWLYDAVDEVGGLRRASRDGYFLAIRHADDTTRERLAPLGPVRVEAFQ